MPVCSVIGCGLRKRPNQPSFSIHRIPRNAIKQKQWLEAIGDNINANVKDAYVCSLHFDDKCFNKTLDVIRLRDDAIPSKFVRKHASQHKTDILKENQLEINRVFAGQVTSTLDPLEVSNTANTSTHTTPHVVTGASGFATVLLPMTTTAACTASSPSGPSTSRVKYLRLPMTTTAACTASSPSGPSTSSVKYLRFQNLAQEHKIKKLNDKCVALRKKVKRLNEKVRLQNKKIANFQNIMKDLQERNLINNKPAPVLKTKQSVKLLNRVVSG